MLIKKTGLNIKISDSDAIKSTLKVGQIVKATVIERKGNLIYTVNIRGKIFDAKANIPIQKNKLTLLVEQLTPQIVLKIIEQEESVVNFVKYKQPIILQDTGILIIEALKKLKEAVQKRDRLKATVAIMKLSVAFPNTKIREILEDLEESLIKKRVFDKDKLNLLIKELSDALKENDLEKTVSLFKNALKSINQEQQISKEHPFLQVPFLINSKQEEIYVKKEFIKKDSKRNFKLSIVWKNNRLGTIQIDGLYIGGTISCNIYFSNEDALKLLQSNEEELKKKLKGISLSLNLMRNRLIFSEKRLNIKI